LTEAMRRVHDDLGTRRDTRSVVMAHAFVAGDPERGAQMASDSERDISVGGLQIAPTSLFTQVDYAALGHLHGRHTLTDSVRYSGSPLAYSFSEASHTKGSWLVELGADGFERADFVAAPVPRRLRSLRGELETLLTDPALADAEDCYLQVTLTDSRRPQHAMERLRARFPHTLILAFEPQGGRAASGPIMPRVDGRSDLDIALGFVAEVRDLEATTEEQLLLQLACDSCRVNEEADSPVEVSPGLPEVG
jgi:exonuclease SbcD